MPTASSSQAPENSKTENTTNTSQELYALNLKGGLFSKNERRKLARSLDKEWEKGKRKTKKKIKETSRNIRKNPTVKEAVKKTKEGIKEIKKGINDALKKIKTIINDKEARKEILQAIGAIAAVMIFGNNQDISDKEKSIKETKNELNEMEKTGQVEIYEPQTLPENTKEGEVTRNYRLIAIQLKASMNRRNTEELNKIMKDYVIESETEKIKNKEGKLVPKPINTALSKNIRNLSAISMFRKGIGNYESFKTKLINSLLSSKVTNQYTQTKFVVAILSRSALGKYQILPKHHFHHLNKYAPLGKNWTNANSEEKLTIIYKYLRSESMQNYNNIRILEKLQNKYEGIPEAMAAAYYSGPKSGAAILAVQKKINSGESVELPEWISRKQKMGGGTFGSIYFYSKKAAKYYRNMNKGKITVDNQNDLKVFQVAIAKKETGYLSGKRAKKV